MQSVDNMELIQQFAWQYLKAVGKDGLRDREVHVEQDPDSIVLVFEPMAHRNPSWMRGVRVLFDALVDLPPDQLRAIKLGVCTYYKIAGLYMLVDKIFIAISEFMVNERASKRDPRQIDFNLKLMLTPEQDAAYKADAGAIAPCEVYDLKLFRASKVDMARLRQGERLTPVTQTIPLTPAELTASVADPVASASAVDPVASASAADPVASAPADPVASAADPVASASAADPVASASVPTEHILSGSADHPPKDASDSKAVPTKTVVVNTFPWAGQFFKWYLAKFHSYPPDHMHHQLMIDHNHDYLEFCKEKVIIKLDAKATLPSCFVKATSLEDSWAKIYAERQVSLRAKLIGKTRHGASKAAAHARARGKTPVAPGTKTGGISESTKDMLVRQVLSNFWVRVGPTEARDDLALSQIPTMHEYTQEMLEGVYGIHLVEGWAGKSPLVTPGLVAPVKAPLLVPAQS